MARVLITTTAKKTRWAPYALSDYKRVMRAAQCDKIGRHELVDDVDSADIILFVGGRCTYHFDILSSNIYKAAKDRCFILDSNDNTIPSIPGIYMSIPSRYHSCYAYQYGFYLRVFDNNVLQECASHDGCKYLYSFVGRVDNAPIIRKAIINLRDERAFLKDSWSMQSDQDTEYSRILTESKFVLCPRGFGPSTWRVFEAMRAGRSPVIISNEWQPPPGVRWQDFAVIVKEDEISSIPERLASLEPFAEEMGRRAWEEWERNFSLGSAFNWIVNTLSEIQKNQPPDSAFQPGYRLLEALSTKMHRRKYLREYARETLIRHNILSLRKN